MRTPVRSSLIVLSVCVLTLAAACGKSNSKTDPGGDPSCKENGVTCAAPSECCSVACNGTCFQPTDQSTCNDVGELCGADADCCSKACASNVCVDPAQCVPDGSQCSTASGCCSGACTNGACAVEVTPTLKAGGESCSSGSECASTNCANDQCTSATYCKNAGEGCVNNAECCGLASCVNGTCAATACTVTGQACKSGTECCTGFCKDDGSGNTTCADLSPLSNGTACTTLGNACSLGSDCCSKNCQGGKCVQAYSCSATGDICYRGEDCCSGLCSIVSGEPAGRCEDSPGGCAQGGIPCTGGSTCCSRLCVPTDSGVSVCQPAGGCRMTGDYCDTTAACCNVNGEVPVSQRIACDSDHTCDRGGGCNPPGNICGGIGLDKANASQDCCDGKKAVCKPDSNSIMRCFGGPSTICYSDGHCQNSVCDNSGCSAPCPAGYDSTDPLCCIEPGAVCQFSEQCCNGMPCVPDSSGTLKCGGDAPSSPGYCTPFGARCDVAGTAPCCDGLSCTQYSENRISACLPASPTQPCNITTGDCCKLTGGACTADAECCSGSCVTGADGVKACGDYTTPGETNPSGSCMLSGQSCTVNGDCCAGLSCSIDPGATSGTCQAASVCAETTQSCSATVPCCSATDTCIDGVCTVPATCGTLSYACTSDANCCGGLPCMTLDANNNLVPCAGGSSCSCQCMQPGQTCDTSHPCCSGSACSGGVCTVVQPG